MKKTFHWLEETLKEAAEAGKKYVLILVEGGDLEAVANEADVEGWDFIAMEDGDVSGKVPKHVPGVSVMFKRKRQ